MRRLTTKSLSLLLSLGLPLTFMVGCIAPPLESPPPQVAQQSTAWVQQRVKDKVDVLFLVDTSQSMDLMMAELRNRFDQFFQVFTNLAEHGTYADLHIGVVTADYGAGISGAPGCAPFGGGGGGKLVAKGDAAPDTCKEPTGGKRWIEFKFDAEGGTGNLPDGQNLVQTFQCMASFDTSINNAGCGFEHVLESVYAALHNTNENAGFLRDEALLTVVFLTNEDDCSAPGDSDLFDPNKQAQYGHIQSYRCTNYGIVCGSPPKLPPYADSAGDMSGCVPAPNPSGAGPGKLFDVSRYINYFSKPASEGGVKRTPLDVILVGIDAPEEPVRTILAQLTDRPEQSTCSPINENSTPACTPQVQHSCLNSAMHAFYGDPAVRLNSVIKSVKNHQVTSICETDYTSAMQNLGSLIVSNIGSGCIPAELPDVADPDCVVEDVTSELDGTFTINQIPRCDRANGEYPCWQIGQKADCMPPNSPQGVGLTIDRAGQPAPDETDARFFCNTIAK